MSKLVLIAGREDAEKVSVVVVQEKRNVNVKAQKMAGRTFAIIATKQVTGKYG